MGRHRRYLDRNSCRSCGVDLTSENWYPADQRRCAHICKTCRNEENAAWRERTRYRPARANQDPVAHRAAVSRWKEDHPEVVSAQRRRARAAHPDRDRIQVRGWKLTHPDRVRTQHLLRRARRFHGGRVDQIVPEQVWIRDRGFCAICGWFVPFDNFHLDHWIPLAKGGTHIWGNVVVSHPLCNLRKGDRLPDSQPPRFCVVTQAVSP